VVYKVDNIYSAEHERGIFWNDTDIAINWPVLNPVLSLKDSKNLTLQQYLKQ
ncbi:MAG TPA: dTDP-4-dehydrorhamnose 3,5-epimerase, partial [Bacteroidales bacterium]|nr:dTDP-4-dehydrorhamnose 3,5-epimerase [Bacteroidales bacterium]